MAAVFGLVMLVSGIARSFMRDLNYNIPGAEVAAQDRRWLAAMAAAQPVPRMAELESMNEGLALCSE
jgi:hypothetical protein